MNRWNWHRRSACPVSPTLAVISGGKLVNHAVGAQPKSAILDMLDAVKK